MTKLPLFSIFKHSQSDWANTIHAHRHWDSHTDPQTYIHTEERSNIIPK
jgi:hypothetical protein